MRSAEAGQGDVTRRGVECHLAGRLIEVQNLDEQRANLARPRRRRSGEDAPDAALNFNRIVTVHNRHEQYQ